MISDSFGGDKLSSSNRGKLNFDDDDFGEVDDNNANFSK
jgi:hypothetical protein